MSGKAIIKLLAGMIICLFVGLIYAWSIFVTPMEADMGWDRTQTSVTFTVSMIAFCLAGMVSGKLLKTKSPKLVLFIAAVLFLVGFFLSSTISSVGALYITYGVLCGSGVGLAYNCILGTVVKWFPGRTGIISGLLLMSFGFGGMVLGKVAFALIAQFTWRTTFKIFAVLFAVVIAVLALLISAPKAGEVQAPAAPAKKDDDAADSKMVVVQKGHGLGNTGAAAAVAETKKAVVDDEVGADMTTGEMLKRPAFWLFFIWAVVLSATGLAIMGNAAQCAADVGATAAKAASIAGIFSICNGLGRIMIGLVFDRWGRKVGATLANVLITVGMAVVAFASMNNSVSMFTFGGIITILGYGCIPPLNAAFINKFYGPTNYPMNLSAMTLNLIPASILGPIVTNMVLQATGSYTGMYLALIVVSAIVYIMQRMIKRP